MSLNAAIEQADPFDMVSGHTRCADGEPFFFGQALPGPRL
jgi:hypothetical protein